MYLLKRDYPNAVEYYRLPGEAFSLNQERRLCTLARGLAELPAGALPRSRERIFDEQIRLYPAATETVAALYWRGRLYESQDHNPAQAAANYRAIVRAYQHFFYAQMARARLAALGDHAACADSATGQLSADRGTQPRGYFSSR